MISIISTFGFAVVIIVHVAISSTQVNFGDGNQLAKIILAWIAAVLMAVFGFLLFNLILLHIFLIVNGLTTYQFLQQRKKQEQNERKSREDRERMSMEMSNNKVMPEV